MYQSKCNTVFITCGKILCIAVLLSACASEPVVEQKPASVQELILAGDTESVYSLFQTQSDINETDSVQNTPLHTAASVNNVTLVNFLLANGANSELKNNDGDTPMHVALKNNAFESAGILSQIGNNIFSKDGFGKTGVEISLENGTACFSFMFTSATANLQDVQGQSLVHYFVKDRNIDAVNFAVENNFPLSIKDMNGTSPLALAYNQADDISTEIAAILILANATPERGEYAFFEDSVKMRNPSMRFDDGQAPLHLAVITGKESIVRYLISHGAAIQAKDTSGSTPLHEAVRYGQVTIAQDLINGGADVNARDSMSKTPLLIITPAENREQIYRLLLAGGAYANATDAYGDSILHIATATDANVSVLSLLTQYGADINERNKKGVTPLAQAIERQTAEHIVFFASNGADVHASDNNSITPLIRSFDAGLDMTKQLINAQNINTRDSFGNTPLYIAVERNTDLEQIQFLVSMGADVNARNKSGHSALYIAVENNNRAVGEYLLANNADVFSSDDNQSSPLSLALSKGGFVQEWFLTSQVIQSSDGLGDTPLHYAAKRELNNAIFALLERGANPNAQNTNGENPLFHAAKANSIDTVRLLSENGTNQNARDYLGSTVLHTCVQWDSQDVAVYLIENGIDINAQNLSGKTALHQAARTGRFDMVNLLLRAGANIHAADSMGRTPLMDAIAAENITIVSLLIDNGASISIPEMYGRNAYHEAVETANIELIEILRNAGGNALGRDTNGQTPLSLVLNTNSELIFAVLGNDIHLADSDGNTPLHIAVINGAATDIVAELIDAGYSANRRNSEGATALLLAVKNGNITLAQMFLEHDADPFISDNSGNSALIYALKNNAAMLNTIVQEVGNKQDIAGETVLHYAAREADVGTVQRLLSMGLDRTIKNISGETAYNIALRWEKNDIAALLQ